VPAKSGKGGRHRATQQELHAAVKDGNIEMISAMLGALEQEHEHLYLSLLRPIIGYVQDILPEDMRETNGNEFYFEDLEKLSGDDVARISEWLTEKVDALSTRLKAEPKE